MEDRARPPPQVAERRLMQFVHHYTGFDQPANNPGDLFIELGLRRLALPEKGSVLVGTC